MIKLLTNKRYGPIGVDIGTRSIKLVQFSGDRTRLIDAVRWDFTPAREREPSTDERTERVVEAIRFAREGRNFRGHEAVICLTSRQLFVQNVRVPKADFANLSKVLHQELAGRLPFAVQEAEIRHIETADVRQGEGLAREMIVMACHRPMLDQSLAAIEAARLRPLAVDVEPMALARSYARQFRRDEDRGQRTMIVHLGYSTTLVVIVQDDDVLFVKYVDVGGRQLDEAVARHLKLDAAEAAALRRHNGDRRTDQQDPEVSRSLSAAVRPAIERLAGELAMCVRYHSVTFRGQTLARLLLGGGEASPALQQALSDRLSLKCELSDPLRGNAPAGSNGRSGQWDIAAGLALREVD